MVQSMVSVVGLGKYFLYGYLGPFGKGSYLVPCWDVSVFGRGLWYTAQRSTATTQEPLGNQVDLKHALSLSVVEGSDLL